METRCSKKETQIRPGWKIGNLYEENIKNWILKMLRNNPGIFAYFSEREKAHRYLVSWYGEFPGKFLTAVAECYSMTQDERLLPVGAEIVNNLVSVQTEDGYLGPYRKDQRMIGFLLDHPGISHVWDVWGHYHSIYGLCLWFEATGDAVALQTAERAANCVIRFFSEENHNYIDSHVPDQDFGIAHGFLKLYEITKRAIYLEEANRIIDVEWKNEEVGDWKGAALSGVPFYKMVKPRWESLHSILALGERWRITGNEEDYAAFTRIWESIRETDRHNDGGFSSGEGACGNPYDLRAVETCCTILWMVFSTEYLRLTKDCRAADELELSFWNAYAGSILNAGSAFTYNTPMDGCRIAAIRELSWQAPSGTPDLSCCQMNGTRGFGQWGKWGLISANEGIYCNYYGACTMQTSLPDGSQLRINQVTRYPMEGTIDLEFKLEHTSSFSVFLRIPAWSAISEIWIDGVCTRITDPGKYAEIKRDWNNGDCIKLRLDMSPHFWRGERECNGKVSVYCGPILLAADSVFSGLPWVADESFISDSLSSVHLYEDDSVPAWFCADAKLSDGTSIRLVDFASAGNRGQEYVSWLKAPDLSVSAPSGLPEWCAR